MSEESNSVERALSILETVAHSANGLTNSDLSRRLSIPKSSASYILRVLERRGYLLRAQESGKYRLGLKLMSLARETLAHLDVRTVAKPVMESFVRQARLPVHLALLDNGRAVYIEKVEAESFVKMDIWVGHRLPVHTTAIGKVLASGLSEAEILALLELRGMERKTPHSITTPKKYLAELKQVSAQGYALDNEENSLGVRCVAAPVHDANGQVLAALGTSNTTMQIDNARLPKVIEAVKTAAARISQQLGFAGAD
jgi:DNA-binding IclR family transcriptional regulator